MIKENKPSMTSLSSAHGDDHDITSKAWARIGRDISRQQEVNWTVLILQAKAVETNGYQWSFSNRPTNQKVYDENGNDFTTEMILDDSFKGSAAILDRRYQLGGGSGHQDIIHLSASQQ